MDTEQTATNTTINKCLLKRTRDGERLLIEVTDKGQSVINAIIAKHRRRYLSLWAAPSRTDEERAFMGKFDRIIGKLKKRQRAVVGAWS